MTEAIVVASHRRSGTHLTLDTLRANTQNVTERFLTLDRIEPGHPEHLPLDSFDDQLRSARRTVLVKTHALPGLEGWTDPAARSYALDLLASSPTIYVHRDGRDVMRSLYDYVTTYSSEAASLSFGEFMRSEHNGSDATGLSRAAYWQHHVLAWLDREPAATAGFEALQADLAGSLEALARAVGLALRPTIRPVRLASSGANEPRLLRRARRILGLQVSRRSTAIRPRSGGSGGWRERFDQHDLAWFETQAAEAMRRLGYE